MGSGTFDFLSVGLCYAVVFVLFWAPGAALAAAAIRFFPRLARWQTPLAFAAGCFVGYLAFWLYLINSHFGLVASWLILAAGVLFCLVRPRTVSAVAGDASLWLMFLVGLFYLSAHFLSGSGDALDVPRFRYFEGVRPGDNILPYCFASILYARDPMLWHGNPVIQWHFSDRPPLQAGVYLLMWGLNAPFGIGIVYQCVGTVLQTSWVLAFWSLAGALGWPARQTRYTIGATAFTGFIFYNCVYVWPKMLAGALFLFGLAPIMMARREGRRLTAGEAAFSAVCWSLALLAHPGVAFSGLGLLAIAVFWMPRLCPIRYVLLGTAIIIAFHVPWIAYERFVDPNEARLAKWHLAGVREIDKRPLPTVIRWAYGKLSLESWLDGRVANFESLFGSQRLDEMAATAAGGWAAGRNDVLGTPDRVSGLINPYRLRTDLQSLATIARTGEREYVFRALGFLNFGWLGVVAALRRKRGDRGVADLLIMNLLTTLIWCVLEFTPGNALIEHTSYAMMLLYFFIAAWGLWQLGSAGRVTVAAAQTVLAVILWGVALPGRGLAELSGATPDLHVLPLVIGLVLGIALWAALIYPGLGWSFPARRLQVPSKEALPAGSPS